MKSTLYLLLFLSFNSFSQLDTFNIYQNNSSLKFNLYFKAWFPKSQRYSYSDSNLNKQDSIAMSFGYYNNKKYYLKVYNKKQQLILEGIKSEYGDLIGNVKHYYKNGQIKKIENYSEVQSTPIKGKTYGVYDVYGPYGKWRYYSKKGKLVKEKNYVFKTIQEKPKKINFVLETTRYNAKGQIKSKKSKTLHKFPW